MKRKRTVASAATAVLAGCLAGLLLLTGPVLAATEGGSGSAPVVSSELTSLAPSASDPAETPSSQPASSETASSEPSTSEPAEAPTSEPAEAPASQSSLVLDYADQLSEEQEAICIETLKNFRTQYQMGMAVILANGAEVTTAEEALPQLQFDSVKGGIVLLLDPRNVTATIYTVGSAQDIFNDIWAGDFLDQNARMMEKGDYLDLVDELAYQAGLLLEGEQAQAATQQKLYYSNGDVPLDLEQKVYDFANLLTDSEEQTLAARIRAFCQQTNLDLPLVTINDAEGKSSRAYADDFYDYNGFGVGENADGMLLLIDMDNRQAYLSTTGRGISLFTDSAIYDVTDPVAQRLGDGDYFGGCQTGIDLIIRHVEEEMEKATPAGRLVRSARRLPIYLLIAGGISAIILWGMARGHKTARRARNAASYLDQQSLFFPLRDDQFIRSSLTRSRIESSSSGGGGGTSTHSGSSGSSHGGGGSSF